MSEAHTHDHDEFDTAIVEAIKTHSLPVGGFVKGYLLVVTCTQADDAYEDYIVLTNMGGQSRVTSLGLAETAKHMIISEYEGIGGA